MIDRPAAIEELFETAEPSEQSVPLWMWPNLLSLDAPIVAVLWQSFLARCFSITPSVPARLVLGLTVWAIYLLDRLLDARKQPSGAEALRHRYSRRHSKAMTWLLATVLMCDAAIAIGYLRPVILRDGLLPLGGVLLYLALFHLAGRAIRIPKEIAVAFLFTAGISLTAWATFPCPELALAAAAFFVLCLANLVAIEAWEWRELPSAAPHPWTRWLARNYMCWVAVAAGTFAILGRNDWYASIALSAAACWLLYITGRRLSLEARRALVDGVLLTPILFLLFR